MKISFDRSEVLSRSYKQIIIDLIDADNSNNICDIGGGANPLLDEKIIRKIGLKYYILDISKKELEKAPISYNKLNKDISSVEFDIKNQFDLVFSKMLAEHIKDAELFHFNVNKLLVKGGIAVHFFPTLYSLPFIVNKIIPEGFSMKLLNIISPRDNYQHAKFPAYYKWCRGPYKNSIERFIRSKYEILEYKGGFGHRVYYKKLKIFEKLHDIKTNYLLKHPNPYFTSFALVILKKI
mgnify:FL=1